MSDKNIEQRNVNTGSTQPTQPGGRQPSTAPVRHWKRWKFKSSIVLMLLAIIAVIVFLAQAGLAKQYAGIGAALCVIACFGFLVWHTVHLFAEEDAIEEKEYPEEFPELNSANKEKNPTAPPPPESGR